MAYSVADASITAYSAGISVRAMGSSEVAAWAEMTTQRELNGVSTIGASLRPRSVVGA